MTNINIVTHFLCSRLEENAGNGGVHLKVSNPFLVSVPILCSLKKPENLWVSGVFERYTTETLARNGLNYGQIYPAEQRPFTENSLKKTIVKTKQ